MDLPRRRDISQVHHLGFFPIPALHQATLRLSRPLSVIGAEAPRPAEGSRSKQLYQERNSNEANHIQGIEPREERERYLATPPRQKGATRPK